jgi:hypothetical protein
VARPSKAPVLLAVLVLSLVTAVLPALAQEPLLTESFASSDGALTFDYPAGWHTKEFIFPGIALLGTSEDVVTDMYNRLQNNTANFLTGGEAAEGSETGSKIPPGELALIIIGPQASRFFFGAAPPTSLEDALGRITRTGDEVQLGELEEITFGDYEALIITASSPDMDTASLVIDINGQYAWISGIAAPGEYEQFGETVLAVAATMDYVLPEGAMTFRSDGISFDYPAGWFTMQLEGSVFVVNSMEATSMPAPGQIMINVTLPSALPMYGMNPQAEPAAIARDFATMWGKGEKELGDIEEITIGEHEGLLILFSSEANEGGVVVLTPEDGPVTIAFSTALGELPDFEEDILLIIESIVYTP